MWQQSTFIAIVVVFSQVFANLEQAFMEIEIVPDIIDEPPHQLVKVAYPSGGLVKLGNYLTPTQVLKIPRVQFNGDPSKYYLLSMIDPDAPSRAEPTLRLILHWLVGNIPGDKVCHGETIVEYIPSAPPQGSGYHRYAFLVYEQPSYIEFDEPHITNRSLTGRPYFSMRNFASKYDLGEPIFGNFYQAEYDDSVPLTQSTFDD